MRSEDDGWQFLGIDTGYHGHYMGVPPAAQQAALDQLHLGEVEHGPNSAKDPHWPGDQNPYFRRTGDGGLPVVDPTHAEQVTVRSDELT